MALPTWKCEVCNKKFTVNEWVCADGVSNHIVETKQYYLADAPTDGSSSDELSHGQTIICNIPPDKKIQKGNEVHIQPGGNVTFIRGQYSSTDPEIQYWLDLKGGFCNKDRWNEVWLSREQKNEMKEMDLRAREQRLENDRNELLTQTQAKVGAR